MSPDIPAIERSEVRTSTGGAAGAVDPVVEDQGPFGVVAAGLVRIVDDKDAVEGAVELDAVSGEALGALVAGPCGRGEGRRPASAGLF
jgi:hypothetical protein